MSRTRLLYQATQSVQGRSQPPRIPSLSIVSLQKPSGPDCELVDVICGFQNSCLPGRDQQGHLSPEQRPALAARSGTVSGRHTGERAAHLLPSQTRSGHALGRCYSVRLGPRGASKYCKQVTPSSPKRDAGAARHRAPIALRGPPVPLAPRAARPGTAGTGRGRARDPPEGLRRSGSGRRAARCAGGLTLLRWGSRVTA